MAQTTLNIRMDEELKRQFQKFCSDIGMYMTTYVFVFAKPEHLKYDKSGWWSRRIDDGNRIVYRIKNNELETSQCGSNYRDK